MLPGTWFYLDDDVAKVRNREIIPNAYNPPHSVAGYHHSLVPEPEMNELDIAKALIPQLLSSASPEYGARLKQRLNTELVAQGFSPFNERQFGFKKFSEFLSETLGSLVELEHFSAGGDIRVSLKATPQSPSLAIPATHAVSPVIRSDVWQAFTNPDENRKRFLKKTTGEVVHFVEGAESAYEAQVKNHPVDFVQIDPVTGEIQKQWMLSFIEQKRLSASDREALTALIQGKYSSSLNAAFARVLGANGEAWREFRTAKIDQAIRVWAKQHSVEFSDLCVARNEAPITKKLAVVNQGNSTPKERAVHLLALLSDEDISRIIIPAILSTLLLRTNS